MYQKNECIKLYKRGISWAKPIQELLDRSDLSDNSMQFQNEMLYFDLSSDDDINTINTYRFKPKAYSEIRIKPTSGIPSRNTINKVKKKEFFDLWNSFIKHENSYLGGNSQNTCTIYDYIKDNQPTYEYLYRAHGDIEIEHSTMDTKAQDIQKKAENPKESFRKKALTITAGTREGLSRRSSTTDVERFITMRRLTFKNTILQDKSGANEATALKLFKKITIVLENHFSIKEFPLNQVMIKFIDHMHNKYKKYVDKEEIPYNKIKVVCDNFCKEINQFLEVLGLILIQFYNLKKAKFRVIKSSIDQTVEPEYKTCDVLNLDNLTLFISTVQFCPKLYHLVFYLLRLLKKQECIDFKRAQNTIKDSFTLEALKVDKTFCLERPNRMSNLPQSTSDTKISNNLQTIFNQKPNQNLTINQKSKSNIPPRIKEEQLTAINETLNEPNISKEVKDTWKLKISNFFENEQNNDKGQFTNESIGIANFRERTISHCRTENEIAYDNDFQNQEDSKAYQDAIDVLKCIRELENPFQKMKSIQTVKKKIHEAIYNHYIQQGFDRPPQLLDGENCNRIITYILINAEVDDLPVHFEFIERFLPKNLKAAFCGYYLASVQTASFRILNEYKNYINQNINK